MIGLSVLLATLALYALFSARLDRWSITAPIVFVAVGAVIGPSGLDLLDVSPGSETTKALAEGTLAILLFADASTIRLREVEGDATLPIRLLLVGLPFTIVVGTVSAFAVFDGIGWAGAALIASILAPTDAALGLGIFSDRSVPVRIRRALNVESGLNDGIATPFVTLFLAMVLSEEGVGPSNWLTQAAIDLALAVAVAVAVGGAGGWSLRKARHRGWMSETSEAFAVLGLALLSYTGALAIGGNGFVAAFVGGLLFGSTAGQPEEATGFTERVGLLGSYGVWVIFGAAFVGGILVGPMQVEAVAYAVLSLTLVRILPVAIALGGTGLDAATVAFMGWFGPRGLASVVFTLLAFEALREGGAGDLLVGITTWTILLSVLLHGITARPLAAAYGRVHARSGDPSLAAPHVPEPRISRRL
jgi:NhaP-type Na+/H+ or K+/H+ antiporter